jgi:mono/diheme cytochrome c family protein
MNTLPLRSSGYLVLATFLAATLLPIGAIAYSPKESARTGAVLFRDKGCAYCHGATAKGTHKAPSLDVVRKSWKPAQIRDQIENGGQRMPSFSDSVTEDEVSQLIAYIRAKKRRVPPPVTSSTPIPETLSNPAQ